MPASSRLDRHWRALSCLAFVFEGTASANDAPHLSGSPATVAIAGEPYSFTPRASDPDGDRLRFRLVNRPWWMQLDRRSGRLSGTAPADAAPGTAWKNLQLSVSDGRLTRWLPPFSIRIGPAVTATGTITVTWAAPTRQTDGSPLLTLAGFRLWYGRSAESLDQVLRIADPRATTRTLEGLGPGRWYFAMTAYSTDGRESRRTSAVSVQR